jgi:hypothetical protein
VNDDDWIRKRLRNPRAGCMPAVWLLGTLLTGGLTWLAIRAVA